MSDFSYNVEESDFGQLVVTRSHEKPVLVDISADWCAQMPAAVQVAAVASSINGLRCSTMLRTNSCTRWGCEPWCPPPCAKERWDSVDS